MKLFVVIIFVFLIVACATPQDVKSKFVYKSDFTYAELAKLHKRQSKTQRGYRYEVYQLIPEHNKFWSLVDKRCRPMIRQEGLREFEFIFIVDSSGTVIDAKSEFDSDGVNCFLDGVKQIKYPSPPYEYWYEIVSVK